MGTDSEKRSKESRPESKKGGKKSTKTSKPKRKLQSQAAKREINPEILKKFQDEQPARVEAAQQAMKKARKQMGLDK